MEEYHKHIQSPYADKSTEAICGAQLSTMDWTFTSIDHAFCSADGGFRLLPCPACAARVIDVLTEDAPMTDLLPCPFCGGEANTDEASCRIFGARTGSNYAVACSFCEVSGPGADSLSQAIAAWNTRAPGWQPIETAPKDGTVVLLWVPDFRRVITGWHCKATGLWPHDEPFNDDGEPCNVGLPTHWMPLPTPPDSEGKQ